MGNSKINNLQVNLIVVLFCFIIIVKVTSTWYASDSVLHVISGILDLAFSQVTYIAALHSLNLMAEYK